MTINYIMDERFIASYDVRLQMTILGDNAWVSHLGSLHSKDKVTVDIDQNVPLTNRTCKPVHLSDST